MHHVILGSGAIGSLIASAITPDSDVTIISNDPAALRRSSVCCERGGSVIERKVQVASSVPSNMIVDVLWIATKAPLLFDALEAVKSVPRAVVPLLNGIDHVERLATRFERVVPATIVVEAESVGRGVVRQHTPHAVLNIANDPFVEELLPELNGEVLQVVPCDDGLRLLWSKAHFYSAFALSTVRNNLTAEQLREDQVASDQFFAIAAEVRGIAAHEGIKLDADAPIRLLHNLPGSMRSSLARDVMVGRESEIDAVGYSMIRKALRYRIEVPALLRAVSSLSGSLHRRPVFTYDAPAPVGPYDQGIVSGNTLYVSGQLGLDPHTGNLLEGLSAQVDRALRNIKAVVAAAGLRRQDINRVTLFLTDMQHFDEANAVYRAHFPDDAPSRTTVAAIGLPRGSLIEIDGIATAAI